jgi:adenylate cyclase
MADSRPPGDDTSTDADGREPSKPAPTEVRAALERILASRCFQQAGRASDFLRFVVEQTLAGAGQRLKGYTIGVEVFGRPPDFDAQSDALVRVEAGRLRRRLVEYYAHEGAADPVRIELPRGTYAVEYRFACADDEGAAAAPVQLPEALAAAKSGAWQRAAFGLGALLAVALGVISWQQSQLREAARALAQFDEPQRTEWPRIVVVPFENLSANAELDALAASMTEEVMLRLDELDLFVIASQSSWYGPGDEPNFDRAAAGGGYVLTGSVRGSGAQARITARLIEASTGGQLWTAAYDEALTPDLLPAFQERVARDVVAIAAPYGPIFEAELARARRSAHAPLLRDCFARYHEYRRRVTPAGYKETLECLENVSARQPHFAPVWSGLAMLQIDEYSSSFGRTGEAALDSARRATEKALAIDAADFQANLALTRVQFFDGDPAFRRTIDRTIALRPSSAQAYAQAGFLLVVTGKSADGLAMAEKARALTKVPQGFYFLTYAASQLRERRFADALESAAKVEAPDWVFAQAVLAAAAAHGGQLDVARAAAARIRALYPLFEAEALANFERWHFDSAFQETLISGLRAAGLKLVESPEPTTG